ncbi:ArsR family transcriptional regulator [Microvirga ossetica]|uniref:ArsR family transcriptional regulator n=1 Tax=Microvirga ossetica TaxID=1882682 RepID=A0A1B2EP04_9HYPH|nr:arsenate reductase ArsC [Microvirga ossetica]ANY81552.1 ArsR family transcriptional regulator [Microvirga ossetica]
MFLCTANAARSILAEAILNELGKSRFHASSAGSQPLGAINRYALNLVRNMGHDTAVLRSKSLDEFAGSGAPHMDLVFTVCDSAVNEACPVWPGHPTMAHWGVPDPKAATGTEAEIAVAFDEAYRMLRRRIELLLAIPIGSIDRLALEESLREIGRSDPAAHPAPEQTAQ